MPICHYGIKGQRWGVRRFQNTDGTYTEAGKVRRNRSYGTSSVGNAKTSKAQRLKTYTIAEANRRERQKAKQPWRYMSDEDLDRETRRLQKETNYVNARKQNIEQTSVFARGKKIAGTLLLGVATATIGGFLRDALKAAIIDGSARVKDILKGAKK